MKKLIVLIVLAMLFVLLIPISVCAGVCCDSVVVKGGGNCNQWWYTVTWKSSCDGNVSGTGPFKWVHANKTTYAQGAVWVRFFGGAETCTPTGPKIYYDKVCDPNDPNKPMPGSKGSSAPKPIVLPKRQPYLLFVDEHMYCYTIMQTPILGNVEDAWCKSGSAPEDTNNFCLQSNYQGLYGCMLENYRVHQVSYIRMRLYHR